MTHPVVRSSSSTRRVHATGTLRYIDPFFKSIYISPFSDNSTENPEKLPFGVLAWESHLHTLTHSRHTQRRERGNSLAPSEPTHQTEIQNLLKLFTILVRIPSSLVNRLNSKTFSGHGCGPHDKDIMQKTFPFFMSSSPNLVALL